MYVMCGLGTLTKGPVGFVLPGLVVLCVLVARRDLREIGRLRLFSGALIMAVLVGPWMVLFSRQAGGGETWALLVTENIHRYLNAWNNVHPWHYYLWRFPLDFLPWTLLLPAAVWRSRKAVERAERSFLWIWFAVVFLFYSASTGKRGVYILPLHPPAAILVGWFWDRVVERSWTGAAIWDRATRFGLGGAFALLGGAVAWRAPSLLEPFGGTGRAGLVLWGLLTTAAGFAIIVQPSRRTIALAAGTVALVVAGAVVHGVPAVNQREKLLEFTGAIARSVPQGAPLGIVTHAEELAFYAGRFPDAELKPGRLMDAWLRTPGTVYMILDGRCLHDLRSRPELHWELLAERELAKGTFYVVVRRETEARS
jgi:4-amino-4-deoxy-L-arabinose transferase-like glycosyltransferase